MEELNMWMVRITWIMVLFSMFIGFIFFLRHKYGILALTSIIGEFVPPHGRGYIKMLPVEEGGKITLVKKEGKGKRKKEVKKTFFISDLATYTILFPDVPKWLFPLPFIQHEFSKAVFDEETWEPMTLRRGRLLGTPRRLANLFNLGFSEIGMMQAAEEKKERLASKKSGLSLNTGAIIFLLAVLVIGGYWVYQNLDVLKAATGVP